MRCPSRRTSPASSGSRSARQRSIVLLPEPDGPSTALTSPRWTPNVTPREHLGPAVPLVDVARLKDVLRDRGLVGVRPARAAASASSRCPTGMSWPAAGSWADRARRHGVPSRPCLAGTASGPARSSLIASSPAQPRMAAHGRARRPHEALLDLRLDDHEHAHDDQVPEGDRGVQLGELERGVDDQLGVGRAAPAATGPTRGW